MKIKYLLKFLTIYISVSISITLISLIINILNDKYRFNLGLPFKIYESFQVNDSPFKNSGFFPWNIIYNGVIYFAISIIIFIIFKKTSPNNV